MHGNKKVTHFETFIETYTRVRTRLYYYRDKRRRQFKVYFLCVRGRVSVTNGWWRGGCKFVGIFQDARVSVIVDIHMHPSVHFVSGIEPRELSVRGCFIVAGTRLPLSHSRVLLDVWCVPWTLYMVYHWMGVSHFFISASAYLWYWLLFVGHLCFPGGEALLSFLTDALCFCQC